MEAKEIRIGNNIKIDGVVVTVDGRTIFDFWCYEDRRRKHEPIPLTEEWLLKLGFREVNGHVFLFPENDSFRLWGFAWNIEQFLITGEWVEISTPSIKYVHQLQNLYHALTGEELKLKQPV